MMSLRKVSAIVVLGCGLASLGIVAQGCGGGCALADGSTEDLSGSWHGGCGTDSICKVVDDAGDLTVNCPGSGSCSGSACGEDVSLDCTSAVDGTHFTGDLKLSSHGSTITGTLSNGDTDCNLIFERVGEK